MKTLLTVFVFVACCVADNLRDYPFRKVGDKYCDLRPLFTKKSALPSWRKIEAQVEAQRKNGLVVRLARRVRDESYKPNPLQSVGAFSGVSPSVLYSLVYDGKKVFLKNYPEAKKAGNGTKIECWAVAVDAEKVGSATLEAYDHGIPFIPGSPPRTIEGTPLDTQDPGVSKKPVPSTK